MSGFARFLILFIILLTVIYVGYSIFSSKTHQSLNLFVANLSKNSIEAIPLEDGLYAVSSKMQNKDLNAERALKLYERLQNAITPELEALIDQQVYKDGSLKKFVNKWGPQQGVMEFRIFRFLKSHEYVGSEIKKIRDLQSGYRIYFHQNSDEFLVILLKAIKLANGVEFVELKSNLYALAAEFASDLYQYVHLFEGDLYSPSLNLRLATLKLVLMCYRTEFENRERALALMKKIVSLDIKNKSMYIELVAAIYPELVNELF